MKHYNKTLQISMFVVLAFILSIGSAYGVQITSVNATSSINGVYSVLTFTSNGTFTVADGGIVEILLVGGGGGGGGSISGGGGAGGFIWNTSYTVGAGTYVVKIGNGGAGGAAGSAGTNGFNTSVTTAGVNYTAFGGGGGGSYNGGAPVAAKNGASGGGGPADVGGAGGTATPSGQGQAGGAGRNGANPFAGGGGGGSNGTGTAAGAGGGGNGGPGNHTNINGTDICYSGGGGGGEYDGAGAGNPGTADAACGGGNATEGNPGPTGGSATPNRGGGGGGSGNGAAGGNGGSGIVVLKFINGSAFFQLTAADLYTNSSLLTFNATINGTFYNTTNGTIQTLFNQSNASTLINITNITAQYYTTFNITNLNFSTHYNALISPLVNITTIDYNTKAQIVPIAGFYNLTIDGITNVNTLNNISVSAGTYVTTIPRNDTILHSFTNIVVYNIFGNPTHVTNNYYTNINVSSGWANLSVWQSVITFNATEVVTGQQLVGFAVNTTDVSSVAWSNYSTTNPYLLLRAGDYNVTFNRTGWFNSTQSFNASRATNNTQTFVNVTKFYLNITARNSITGAAVSNFTINITSSLYNFSVFNLNTTNGTVVIPWTNDTNINISLFNSPEVAAASILWNTTNVTSSPTVINISLSSPTTNIIQFSLYDEITQNLIVGEMANVTLTGSTISYVFNTSTGFGNVTLIVPDLYLIVFRTPLRTQRTVYYQLTNGSSNILPLYLLTSGNSTYVQATIQDSQTQNNVVGAYLYLDRKNLSGTNYYNVEICQSDGNGFCLINVEQNTGIYRVRVVYQGRTVYVSNDTIFSDTIVTYRVPIGTSLLTDYTGSQAITSSLAYSNISKTFTFTWINPTLTTATMCMQVHQIVFTQDTVVNSSCVTAGSSGSIVLGITPVNGSTYIASPYIISNGNTFVLPSLEVDDYLNPTSDRSLVTLCIVLFVFVVTLFTPVARQKPAIAVAVMLAVYDMLFFIGIIYNSVFFVSAFNVIAIISIIVIMRA